MVIARTRILLLTYLSAFAVANAACKSSEEAASIDTTSSELVVDPMESSQSVTIKSEDGACADIRSLIEKNRDALEGLCEGSRIPMPRVSDANDCQTGQAKSITFECFEAKAPPPIASGCRKLPVNDRKKAIAGKARRQVPELPGLVCHRIGGWAGPNSHAPGRRPPMPPPGAEGGQEGPDANRLPPPGAPSGDGARPPMGGGEFGDRRGPGGGPNAPECKDEDFRPEIECCAPGFEDDYEGGPHPHGPPGSEEGPRPPQGEGPKPGEAPSGEEPSRN